MTAPLTCRRKADRKAMASLIEKLAWGLGGFSVEREQYGDREVCVVITHAATGARVAVSLDGSAPLAYADQHVLSWHFTTYKMGEVLQFSPNAFGSVNNCHGRKATDVGGGFDWLMQVLDRRFKAMQDGSAFTGT